MMDCEKDPFSNMSPDDITKLEEVLQSDQAKALLLDSKVVVPFVSHEVSDAIPSIGSDLGDLDNLVLEPAAGRGLYDDDAMMTHIMTQDDVTKTLELESILLDHNYALIAETAHDVEKSSHCDSLTKLVHKSPPARRSLRLRQIEKVEQVQTEKLKGEYDGTEQKNLVLIAKEESGIHNSNQVSQLTVKLKSQDEAAAMTNIFLNDIAKQVKPKENNNIYNRHLSVGSPPKSAISQNQTPIKIKAMKPIVSVQSTNKIGKGEVVKNMEDLKEKTMDPTDAKTIVANSKPKKKISKLENSRKMTSKSFTKSTKNVKRRVSDSISSMSSDMSMSPTKITPPKFQQLVKDKKSAAKSPIESNWSTLNNFKKNKKNRLNMKLPNSKEISRTTSGGSEKPRKKSLSFSEDKSDSALTCSDKKRRLSSTSKEPIAVQSVPMKAKAKLKKKTFRSDSINLDLLGPALFSQPHMMGKAKTEENVSDVKELQHKIPGKEILADATKTTDTTLKPDVPEIEENELDLIKAEMEMDQKGPKTDIKSPDDASTVEKVLPSGSETTKESQLKIEQLETPQNSVKVIVMKSSDVPRIMPITTVKTVEKPRMSTSSEKSEPNSAIERIQVQPVKERNNSVHDKISTSDNEEPVSKSMKIIQKDDSPTMLPERKSQRAMKKRKRIYEDDSDFEEPPIAAIKKVPDKVENEPEESPKRSQRQKPIAKSANVSESEEEKENIAKVESEHSAESTEDESDEVQDEDSEDDPDKLWCLCRQPHNNKFMICCDMCQEWFHGTCVGITRKMGQILETTKKEWICPNCKKGVSTIKRPTRAAAKKKQEAANQSKAANKKQQDAAKQNNKLQSPPPSSASLLKPVTKHSPKAKTLEKEDVKEEMRVVEDSPKQASTKTPDTVTNGKAHLLRKMGERRELVLMKRDPAKKAVVNKQVVQQRVSPRKEISPEKVKVESNVSLQKVANNENTINKIQSANNAKDKLPNNKTDKGALVQSNVARNASKLVKSQNSVSAEKSLEKTKKKTTPAQKDNLPKTKIGKEQVKRKTDCIVCSESAPSGSVYCSSPCLEKYTQESLQIILDQKGFLKENEDWKLKRIVVMDRQSGNIITGSNAPALGEIVQWLKSNPNFEILRPSAGTPVLTVKKEVFQRIDPKAQLVERNDDSDDSGKESVRVNVRNALKLKLVDRCKSAKELELTEEEIQKIAVKIEEELHKYLKDVSKYMKKYRSLIFNIQDSRNKGLFRKIVTGQLEPEQLVRLSTEDLAAPELAQWRANENQHALDMIKRQQVDQPTSAGLRKKTHKGEIEIEDELTVREPEIDKQLAVTPPRPIEETIEVTPEKKEKEPEKKEDNDTTSSHRSHLFDLNCKICTGKIAPPPLDESLPKKVRVAHSISVEQCSPRSLSASEKVVSPTLPQSLTPKADISDDSVDREPTSTTNSSPDSSTVQSRSRKKSQFSVWKGFLAMQDVSKFFTNAYKVSGPTDFLHEDIPETIQVCGRIVPDQVWDYLSKIKQSGHKELIIIRFQAANEEETGQYERFYTYLYSRKRYGVVGISSKIVKDFYIFPLAAHNPVPTVLMPFDGPGLPSYRPHLLLGILVRHKTKQSLNAVSIESIIPESLDNEGSYTPPLEARSYTPPLPSDTSPAEGEVSSSLPAYNPSKPLSSGSLTPPYVPVAVSSSTIKRMANDEYDPLEPSYTPPLEKRHKFDTSVENEDDEKPYDPEQNCVGPPTPPYITSEAPSTSNTLSQLLQKINDNGSAGTHSPMLNSTSGSATYLEEQALILDVLTQKVKEADQKVISLETELEVQIIDDQPPGSSPIDDDDDDVIVIPHINPSGMSSFLDLPENLQEILNSVRHNPSEHSHAGKKDTDIRCLPEEPKKDVDLRCLRQSDQDEDIRQIPRYSPVAQSNAVLNSDEPVADADERGSSQGATPPPICDEDNSSSSEMRPSDPRIKIRTNFVDAAFNAEEIKKVSLSDMSTSELMERAQKELDAIPTETKSDGITSAVSADGITMEHYQVKCWEHYSEPPPPGIDPSDMLPVENVTFASTTPVSDPSYTAQLENHVAIQSFVQQPSVTPPVFSVSVPPPGYPISTPPPGVDAQKLFPPPVGILPPTFMPPPLIPPIAMVAPADIIEPADDRYLPWSAETHSADVEWQERRPRWRDQQEWNDYDNRHYRSRQADRFDDHQENWRRGRFRRNSHHEDFPEDFPPNRGWQDEDADMQYERSDHRRWVPRPPRDNNRRNDSFRGRRNFTKRSRD